MRRVLRAPVPAMLAALLLVAGAGAAGFLLGRASAPASPPLPAAAATPGVAAFTPVDSATLAADPARYRGRPVSVRGQLFYVGGAAVRGGRRDLGAGADARRPVRGRRHDEAGGAAPGPAGRGAGRRRRRDDHPGVGRRPLPPAPHQGRRAPTPRYSPVLTDRAPPDVRVGALLSPPPRRCAPSCPKRGRCASDGE